MYVNILRIAGKMRQRKCLAEREDMLSCLYPCRNNELKTAEITLCDLDCLIS